MSHSLQFQSDITRKPTKFVFVLPTRESHMKESDSFNRLTATLIRIVCLTLIGIGVYLFFRYLFLAVLPFAAAFLFACLSRKTVLFLCEKVHLPRVLSVLLFTVLFFGVSFGGIWYLVSRTFSECMELIAGLDSGALTDFLKKAADSASGFASKLSPALGNAVQIKLNSLFQNVDALMLAAANRFLPAFADTVLAVFHALPRVFLSFGTFLLALFYFGSDYERITAFIRCQLSEKQAAFVRELKREFFDTVLSVLRAYAILLLMTFAELAVGFTVLQLPYAFVSALIIALVDILPVFGTGTILVPWGIGAFFTGNTKLGLCILALYGIITVIRQAAEPKILGTSVGMHPLATLAAMYAGLKLGGIGGLFLFPICAVILKNLNENGCIHLYKTPKNGVVGKAKNKFQKAVKESRKENDL